MPDRYNKLDLALTCVVLVVPVTTLVIANTALLTIALGKGKSWCSRCFQLLKMICRFIFSLICFNKVFEYSLSGLISFLFKTDLWPYTEGQHCPTSAIDDKISLLKLTLSPLKVYFKS